MSENFRKIKKKYLTIAIVAGCVLGACLGVAVTCTLAVIFKTCGVNVHWAIYIPVALVLSAGAACLFYFILRPDDIRIAKKLDKDFALNQKVQTMVEFANAEGEMPALQREQTDEALGAVAKKRVDLKWLLKFAFIPVIALVMLFAGIFAPLKKSADYDPPYSVTTTHAAALNNLIKEIENRDCTLEIGLKTVILLELNELLHTLQNAAVESAMKNSVKTAVRNIDNAVADANSYLKIAAVLKNDQRLGAFSTAFVNAVVDYKNGSVLNDMTDVERMENDVEDVIEGVLGRWKTAYLAELEKDGDAPITLYDFADALCKGLEDEALKVFAPEEGEEEQSAARLFRSADGDGFYNLLAEHGKNLFAHAEAVLLDEASFNPEGYLDSFIKESKSELGRQSYNCMMDEFIRNRLSRIFGVSFGSNFNVAPYPTQSSGGNDKDPETSGDGGYSDGKHLYGSNDEILDPDTGERKKYGDYINPDNESGGTYHDLYYNRAINYISSTECSPEVAAFIRNFFEYLEKEQDNQT